MAGAATTLRSPVSASAWRGPLTRGRGRRAATIERCPLQPVMKGKGAPHSRRGGGGEQLSDRLMGEGRKVSLTCATGSHAQTDTATSMGPESSLCPSSPPGLPTGWAWTPASPACR